MPRRQRKASNRIGGAQSPVTAFNRYSELIFSWASKAPLLPLVLLLPGRGKAHTAPVRMARRKLAQQHRQSLEGAICSHDTSTKEARAPGCWLSVPVCFVPGGIRLKCTGTLWSPGVGGLVEHSILKEGPKCRVKCAPAHRQHFTTRSRRSRFGAFKIHSISHRLMSMSLSMRSLKE